MSKLATATKRLLLGLPFRSDELQGTLLRKRVALPVFASDALSSVAYAPQEVLITLSLAGLGAYALSPWVGVAVIIVLVTVVVSYRQNVHAYPSGGGDYEIATVNLGKYAGLTVASALLVDYTLTVAVSVSSAADNLGALVPVVGDHKVLFAVAAIVVLTAVNLRGVRESGAAFAIPVYCFIVCMVGMIVVGALRLASGDALVAPSAGFGVLPEGGGDSTDDLTQLALVFLVLRSFTQGCAALTGVEAISNGVPAFRKPKSRNAATTLALLGLISVFLFSGMIALARASGVVMAERPGDQLVGAPAGLPAGDAGRAARADGLRRLPARLLGGDDLHGADPRARRQHRVQRLPRARLDPRAGPLPAPPAAHARRPAGVLERHRVPVVLRRRAGGRASAPRSPR